MFEVLVYLFENYFEANIRPDHGTLTRELSAAGFDDDDIERAVNWFSTLEDMSQEDALYPAQGGTSAGMRLYAEAEIAKIRSDGRGFLLFLEQAGVLQPSQREMIIDRAMALSSPTVSLDEIKWTVLITLWSQGKANDYLFIADAVFGDTQPTLH
jgi:Smg protein